MNSRGEFRVQDPATGEVLAEGRISECAEKMGVAYSTMLNAISRGQRSPRWIITQLREPEYHMTDEHKRLANQWDEFIEPIRKRLGWR